MKSATAVATDHDISLGMNVHNTADTGEVVSLELSHEVDIPVLSVPHLHLPGPRHGAREEEVVHCRVPGQPERSQPPAGLIVVVDFALRPDDLL